MHEKTAVPALVEEIYKFLKQADTRELTHIYKELEVAKASKNQAKIDEVIAKIDNYETHVVPMICDIDAGYGNEEVNNISKLFKYKNRSFLDSDFFISKKIQINCFSKFNKEYFPNLLESLLFLETSKKYTLSFQIVTYKVCLIWFKF